MCNFWSPEPGQWPVITSCGSRQTKLNGAVLRHTKTRIKKSSSDLEMLTQSKISLKVMIWGELLNSASPQRFSSKTDFSSVQSLSRVWLFVTPWTAARQASLSITNSRSLLKLTSMESVMPSNHLICNVSDGMLNLLPHNLFLSLFCLFQTVV